MPTDDDWNEINPTLKTRIDSLARQLAAVNKEPISLDPDSDVAVSLKSDRVRLIGVILEFIEIDGTISGRVPRFVFSRWSTEEGSVSCPVTCDAADNPVL